MSNTSTEWPNIGDKVPFGGREATVNDMLIHEDGSWSIELVLPGPSE